MDTSHQQRRDVRRATAAARAEPPARDPALRLQLKHENEVRGVAFAGNQGRLVALGCDICLYSWDLKSGTEEYKVALNPGGAWNRPIRGSNNHSSYLAVSPDGHFAAVIVDGGGGSRLGIVQVYDIGRKKKVYDIMGSEDLFYSPHSLSFSTKGNRLAFALAWRGALQWSLAEAKSLTKANSPAQHHLNIRKNEEMTLAVTHLRGDEILAVGFRYGKLGFYHSQSGEELGGFALPRDAKPWPYSFYQLALSNDGGALLGVARLGEISSEPGDSNMIYLWDMTTGETVWRFRHPKHHVAEAALSPDGRYVAVGFFDDPVVRLYRISDSKEVAAFQGHAKGVPCIAFSPNGKQVASGSLDHTAIVWDVKEGLLPAAERPKADKDFAKCWDALRDGKSLDALEAISALATAGDDGVAYLEGKLAPVRKLDPALVQKLIEQLNHDDPDKRDEASRELGAWGTQVEAAVKKALEGKPPPEAEAKRRLLELQKDMQSLWLRDRDLVRAIRAVYVLERVGSDAAVKLLKKLAEGDPAARLTREAIISLERLEVRKPPKP